MKKIKLIFTLLAAAVLATSCANDGGDSNIALETGAVPNIVKIASTDAFINLLGIQSGETIDLGLTVSIGQGEVQSMDIVLYYITGSKVYKGTFESNITTFPTELRLSQTDIINVIPELNSVADFKLGDQLKLSAILTLKNGKKVNILNDDSSPNYGQDIANSDKFSVLQSYFVSCPSDLAGTYSVLSSGESTDGGPSADENPISNYPYTVTVTATGGGAYTMKDAFGGLYILWYDIYGLTFEVEGNFTDVCGTISGTFSDPFGGTVNYTGTANADGTLSIRWDNSFGDFGEGVYTKQ
jgi:hypothetical protein